MSVPLGDWIPTHADRYGDRPALIDADTGCSRSYREVANRSTRLADGLRGQGVTAGDRIAMCAFNSTELLELVFAVAKLGAIAVLINHRLTAPEIHYILADSGARMLFVSSPLIATAEAATRDTAAASLMVLPTAEERRECAVGAVDELISEGDPAAQFPSVDPDSPAVLMYTSGTTGQPKGAMLTHTNLFWVSLHHNGLESGLSSRDRNIVVAPLFHVGGLAVYTLATVYWGGSNYVLETFAPKTWADAVEKYRVSTAFAVPTMWSAILASGELDTHDLSSMRVAISGGAPCPIPVITAIQAKGMNFVEGFGMTETAASASGLSSEHVTTKAGSIGKPFPYVDFRIVNADGVETPPGVVGELLLRGKSVFAGYWNLPEENSEAFVEGWFRSGDLAKRDADGFYYLVDRKKDMIISGGENVYPIEVEQVLFAHVAVTDVAIIGTPDDYWGETVSACIVPSDATLDAHHLVTELDRYCRERLAGFKVPRRYFLVEELPLTATGKVRKVQVRERAQRLTAIEPARRD